MTQPIGNAHPELTDREKQTLRLIVRGHDAKSIARHLDLSVHTVNERLRAARRKLAVSSSREAARLLLQAEGNAVPKSLGPGEIGDAPAAPSVQTRPGLRSGGRRRVVAVATGVPVMILAVSLLLLATPPSGSDPTSPVAASATAETEAARRWLELVDQERWEDSWNATGTSFRRLNTVRAWSDASKKVRVPLGAVVSRTLLTQESLPAPPRGYQVIKFRTSFANKADMMEMVTLDREGGAWRVVGVYIG